MTVPAFDIVKITCDVISGMFCRSSLITLHSKQTIVSKPVNFSQPDSVKEVTANTEEDTVSL